MHYSNLFPCIGALLAWLTGIAHATYNIEDIYDHTNFFDGFSFFTAADPTDGIVNFISANTANSSGLASISNGQIYLGVDFTTMSPANGRPSVRLQSNKAYTHGLFITDMSHMPDAICGSWPAYWTVGPGWPSSGEIDILEGVNAQTTDVITLHTTSGCSMSTAGSATGTVLQNADCSTDNSSTGCSTSVTNTQGYGAGFNAIGGGVYAMEWTSSFISIYFFPRGSIPSDVTAGTPNPSSWPAPQATFSGSGCNIDSHFMNHNIVFDTTFCGVWASSAWGSSSCASMASSCNTFVAENPAVFQAVYWMITSVEVYQDS